MANTAQKGAPKAQSKFMAPLNVSDALAKVVGKGPMPRTEVTKKLWAYIKKKGLQDPKKKRMIVPDADLAAVIGSKPIDMFEMTKSVNKHLKD
ncbi:MAG: SWIB/MDM2 domain-containing protein [Chlamydiia bacterium]